MFGSFEIVLQRLVSESDEVDSVDKIAVPGHNRFIYDKVCQAISSSNIRHSTSVDVCFNELTINTRMLSIKTLVKSECGYLNKIKELLTNMFDIFVKIFDKKGKRQYLYQVTALLEYFPTIYDLHLTLYKKVKEDLNKSSEIGDILFHFLSKSVLLDAYLGYMKSFSNNSDICKIIKENKVLTKHDNLKNFESIIMSPIQRLPQLITMTSDIYKNTPNNHKDKVFLYKSICILKSITARIDLQRREYDYTNLKDIESGLFKMRLPFSSTQLLANNSVYYVVTSFVNARNLVKLPYNLILFDNNVVIMPNKSESTVSIGGTIFCYPLEDVNFKPKVISSFRDQINNPSAFEDVKGLYSLINRSSVKVEITKEYEELFDDYKTLLKINDDLQHLNFQYKGIDPLKISRSLIELEQQLKSKESEFNLKLGSLLTMTIKSSTWRESKLFLFDSLRQSCEWTMRFNRAKLLSKNDTTIGWKYYSCSKKLDEIRMKELPLQFQSFLLKDNGIVFIPSGFVRAQSVLLAVGLKIIRCLWVCLADGGIIILHYDDKRWMVLESFRLGEVPTVSMVSSTCISDVSYANSPDHRHDSEIWMACDNAIFIHSLLQGQRSLTKLALFLPSEIKSLLRIDGKIFIALKSKEILIYSRDCKDSPWVKESEFSFDTFNESRSEELKEVLYGQGSVYALFETKIIICKKKDKRFSPIKVFESISEIMTLFITADGVWISTRTPFQLMLYDHFLDVNCRIISLPLLLCVTHSGGSVTSMYINENYMWIGTENGSIICISSIDSLYCVDASVPMYFSSKSSVGPITQLLPFQNIRGGPPKSEPLKKFGEAFESFHRTVKKKSQDGKIHDLAFSYEDVTTPSNYSGDDLDSSTKSLLYNDNENFRTTAPMLILAFGNGIADNHDDMSGSEHAEYKNEGSLFTFLE